MATVGKLAAKMILETDEYMASARKVIRTTDDMASKISRVIERSFGGMLKKGLIGVLGAGAVSQITSSLADEMSNAAKTGGSRFQAVLDGIGNGITNIGRGIPIIGDLGSALYSAATAGFDAQKRIREMARAGAEALQGKLGLSPEQQAMMDSGLSIRDIASRQDEISTQSKIIALQREQQALKLEYEAKRAAAENAGLIRDDALFQNFIKKDAALSQQIALERELARIREQEKRDKYWNTFWDDYFDGIEAAAAEWDDLLARIETGINRQVEQSQRDRERLVMDNQGELARIQGASNVQSIGTAVGGVRVAGAVDYSSERMATNLERIRDIDAKIEDNTKYLRELRAN